MGEFSYSHVESDAYYGAQDGHGGHAGYHQEIRSLVPEGVPLLAAILMEAGILDQSQLQNVLNRQHETGDSLAQVLLELDLVGPDQLMTALQTRANYR